MYNKILQRQKDAIYFIETRNNLVTFLALPIIAFVFWLFFRKTGINYAEHLVANIFFAGYYSILSILLSALVLLIPTKTLYLLNYLQLFVHIVYLTLSYFGFLNYSTPRKYFVTAFASILAIGSWFITSALIISIYIITAIV